MLQQFQKESQIDPVSLHFPKSDSGQISSRIWQTPVQQQCVQLITEKKLTKLTFQVMDSQF